MATSPIVDGGPTLPLANGTEIPTFALGVWQIPDGAECLDAVRWALEIGYRHIDTAQIYGNEQSVGEALSQSGVPREDVFVTTKFYPGRHDPVTEMESSLERLGIDYVDLYLVHWPQGGPTWAWPGMERAHELGYAHSIGVSNFAVGELEEVMAIATTPPVVNQIQLSPFNYRRSVIEEGARHGLVTEAYSPLGTGEHLGDAAVQEVARQLGRSPAQVLLRWSIQRGFVVLAKAAQRAHIEDNAKVLGFTLSEEHMAVLDALNGIDDQGQAREYIWWS